MVEGLKQFLNRRVTDVCFSVAKLIEHQTPRAVAAERLKGSELVAVWRRGKYPIFQWENPEYSSFVLIVFPGLTGSFIINEGESIKYESARLKFKEGPDLVLRDPRMFGRWWLFRDESESSQIRSLGPDLLSSDCNVSYILERIKFLQKFRERRNNPVEVKAFLLEQKNLAGIGNYMANEILFAVGLLPTRPIEDISTMEWQKILSFAKSFAHLMVLKKGASIQHYFTLDGSKGFGQELLKVYRKKKCPEDHEIQYIQIKGRGTYFCPVCQS